MAKPGIDKGQREGQRKKQEAETGQEQKKGDERKRDTMGRSTESNTKAQGRESGERRHRGVRGNEAASKGTTVGNIQGLAEGHERNEAVTKRENGSGQQYTRTHRRL